LVTFGEFAYDCNKYREVLRLQRYLKNEDELLSIYLKPLTLEQEVDYMCGEDGNGDNFEKMSMFKIIVYVHFIVSVSILTLIMSNIIIAIMTDTYELVMTKVVQSDYQEINKMIM